MKTGHLFHPVTRRGITLALAMPTNPSTARIAATLAVALLASLSAAACLAFDPDSPVRAYYDFVHGVSSGQPDLAIAQFTDDAVVVAGPLCAEAAPCVGKRAIRERYLAPLRAGRATLPLFDQRYDGHCLRTRGEVVGEVMSNGVATPLRGGHVFEFRGGRISVLRVEYDTTATVAR